jgi:hypothetical protein
MGINQIPEGVPGFIGFCTFVFDIFRGCRAGFLCTGEIAVGKAFTTAGLCGCTINGRD